MKDLKVKDVMKTDVAVCAATDSLMRAADLMRGRDCGIVPIVDENQKLVGALTDRDLCLIVVARNRKASDVKASEFVKEKIITCAADERVEDVLRKMRRYQLKRLIVVNEEREIAGIFSITDVILSAGKNKKLKKKTYATLRSIFKPRPIVLREIVEKEVEKETEKL